MKTPELAKALSQFQTDMPDVKLDSTVKVKMKSGGTYQFKYATLQNILKQTFPVLVKNGLSLSQVFRKNTLVTYLLHSSGEKLVSAMPIDLTSGGMQDIGSRISYLKRYSVAAMLGIVADADDDGNLNDGNSFEQKSIKAGADEYPEKKAERAANAKTQNFEFLKTMKSLKSQIAELDGNHKAYYGFIGLLGFEKSNQIVKREQQKDIWKTLTDYIAEKTAKLDTEQGTPEWVAGVAEGDIPL